MTTSPASCADPEFVDRVRAHLDEVRERIAAVGRVPDEVRVVAVTKTFGPSAVECARAVGLRHVGENYVEELTATRALADDPTLTWHYLGRLQSNKIAQVVAVADVISGVSRVKEIAKLAALRPGAVIDIQVDYTGLAGRSGARESDVGHLVAVARQFGLEVRGLMTVAPLDPDGARNAFASLRALGERYGLRELSMGMSDDFEEACRHGSSEVRLGRLLFGPRRRKQDSGLT